jgi:hypothetical protein
MWYQVNVGKVDGGEVQQNANGDIQFARTGGGGEKLYTKADHLLYDTAQLVIEDKGTGISWEIRPVTADGTICEAVESGTTGSSSERVAVFDGRLTANRVLVRCDSAPAYAELVQTRG